MNSEGFEADRLSIPFLIDYWLYSLATSDTFRVRVTQNLCKNFCRDFASLWTRSFHYVPTAGKETWLSELYREREYIQSSIQALQEMVV